MKSSGLFASRRLLRTDSSFSNRDRLASARTCRALAATESIAFHIHDPKAMVNAVIATAANSKFRFIFFLSVGFKANHCTV